MNEYVIGETGLGGCMDNEKEILELKPCPFCGGEVSITYHSADNVFSIWHKHDECKFIEPMYIDGEYAKSLSDARNIWNERSVPWRDEDANAGRSVK